MAAAHHLCHHYHHCHSYFSSVSFESRLRPTMTMISSPECAVWSTRVRPILGPTRSLQQESHWPNKKSMIPEFSGCWYQSHSQHSMLITSCVESFVVRCRLRSMLDCKSGKTEGKSIIRTDWAHGRSHNPHYSTSCPQFQDSTATHTTTANFQISSQQQSRQLPGK
jgi:hypothetical protein